ncbi:hypothetical protein PoB_004666000 [Plakobranchus ocellatus]|uniref:Uncharacterized protein n=1 Tax=Plakobranchus ocellatus TaxID=259542 RepID=A0AAV4BHX9_9GAST|nr:hypothetical protein PoB_004666000 [Plakobranchus ocellatus]
MQSHWIAIAIAAADSFGDQILSHRPYSPGSTPSVFFLFPDLKRLSNNEEVDIKQHRRRVSEFLYTASPQQGDLRLSGPPSGQGAGSGARTRDRRVPADLRADLQATATDAPSQKSMK